MGHGKSKDTLLDYEALSHVCHACIAQNTLEKESKEYRGWRTARDHKCQINHVGSSGDMEAKGAIAIVSRSIQKHQQRYLDFLGVGDTSCSGSVAETMTVTKRSYNIHMGKSVEKAIIHAEQKMKEAGACLHALVEKHDPESMHVNEDGMGVHMKVWGCI